MREQSFNTKSRRDRKYYNNIFILKESNKLLVKIANIVLINLFIIK